MFLCDPLAPQHKVALHPVDTNVTDWHHLKLIIRQCDDYFARQHFEVQFDLKKGINGLIILGCWTIFELFVNPYLHYQYYLDWHQSLTVTVLLPMIPARPPRGSDFVPLGP